MEAGGKLLLGEIMTGLGFGLWAFALLLLLLVVLRSCNDHHEVVILLYFSVYSAFIIMAFIGVYYFVLIYYDSGPRIWPIVMMAGSPVSAIGICCSYALQSLRDGAPAYVFEVHLVYKFMGTLLTGKMQETEWTTEKGKGASTTRVNGRSQFFCPVRNSMNASNCSGPEKVRSTLGNMDLNSSNSNPSESRSIHAQDCAAGVQIDLDRFQTTGDSG